MFRIREIKTGHIFNHIVDGEFGFIEILGNKIMIGFDGKPYVLKSYGFGLAGGSVIEFEDASDKYEIIFYSQED